MTGMEKTTLQMTLFEDYCIASHPDTAAGNVQRLAQAYPSCILPFARVFLPAGARCPPCPLLPGHLEHKSRKRNFAKPKHQPLEAMVFTAAIQIPGLLYFNTLRTQHCTILLLCWFFVLFLFFFKKKLNI